MSFFIECPAIVQAVGNKPKIIEEYFGRVNSKTNEVSIARMISPAGWIEPAQCPDFDEYTVVLRGILQVITKKETYNLKTGQAILVSNGERVQYSSPFDEGAEYISICLPAFSPETVHRKE